MADKSYHELTDEEWKIVERKLPPAKSKGRPQTDNRAAFNGILWILKSGVPWRLLPSKYGKWNSICKKFRQWTRAGIFETLTHFKTECGEILALDSTFCRVHRHALGARKNAPEHETMQDIDSSRGGKTTKIHILIDEKFRVVKFLISAGNVNDNRARYLFYMTLTARVKRYWLIKLILLLKSVVILKSKRHLCAFPIKSMPR